MNDQKENNGYFTDLQGGLMLIDGAHNNTFRNDTFNIPRARRCPRSAAGGTVYQNGCEGWVIPAVQRG